MPRFYCPTELHSGLRLTLPPGVSRHVQVLRLQPGDSIVLFNGQQPGMSSPGFEHTDGEFTATVARIGRSEVEVEVGALQDCRRESDLSVHLAVCMPANERMDWLVEKAIELGAASIQPLMSERSVLRLSSERAEKKRAHWQSVAIAACEQCGGNRISPVLDVQPLSAWLQALPASEGREKRLLLSLGQRAGKLENEEDGNVTVIVLSGPEGGLSAQEESIAITKEFQAVSLGPRVLRAETAALVALARLTR